MREMLQVNRTLKSLVIRCSGTGKRIFNDISGAFEDDACHLESFGVHGVWTGLSSTTPLSRLLAAVSNAKFFKSLCLENCNLDVASFRILCTSLRTMKHLRHLSFSFPNSRICRDLDESLLHDLYEEFRTTMMTNHSLTSIRVQTFPNSELKRCATHCSNRNRLQLFADDKHASTAYIPHLLESFCKNGLDHSTMYLALKRNLDILPIPISRKRRRGYSPSY